MPPLWWSGVMTVCWFSANQLIILVHYLKYQMTQRIPLRSLTTGHELLHVLVDLFNLGLKGFCFSDFQKVFSVALVFSNVRERLVAENHSPLKCLSCVVIVFEVLISNALVDRIEVDSFQISIMVSLTAYLV